ncbi:hypothetical protein WMY93_004950 [Mugilogobius chulae]|uniref:Ig-like domain-containing protein n=1 Tax=Mugilogobius chulae TaxID=88201 RepID=A0AAW0PYH1_9GOBI
MTETSKSFFYLPFFYLWTGAKGNMLTVLAPPVHLSGDRLGWTLLVCVVSDLQRGHLEVKWKMPSGHDIAESPFTSVVVNSRHRSHSPVSIITVATQDWSGYRCSASHKKRPKMTKRHHINHSSDEEINHSNDDMETGKAYKECYSSGVM